MVSSSATLTTLTVLTALLLSPSSTSVHGFGLPTDTLPFLHSAAATATSHHANQLLASYTQSLQENPLVTKMMTGATLAVTGDAIAQSQAASASSAPSTNRDDDSGSSTSRTTTTIPDPYDVRRGASFGVFDMAYRALQHVSFPIIVTHCHGQFLGDILTSVALPLSDDGVHAAAAAMEQTLASQLIVVPCFYYPAFFALTGSLQGLDAPACWERARANFLPLLRRNLLFWIPVQFVQFGSIPTEWQIPFLSCAGLVWTIVLSTLAGSVQSSMATTAGSEDAATTTTSEPTTMKSRSLSKV